MDILVHLTWVMVSGTAIAESSAQQQLTTTQYTVMQVSGTTDLSGAVKTFADTRTTVECGTKCSQLALVSFFFVKQSSSCYCNDNVDPSIVESNEQGHFKYGYVSQGATQPPPVASPMFPSCGTSASGWTTFQRRMDGSVDFYRNWADYVNGFGSSDGEIWLGLETIHQLTTVSTGCSLCIYLEAGPNPVTALESGYVMYSSFGVESVATNYRLLIGGFSGTPGIGNSLLSHNGSAFSTFDNDNDQNANHCAEMYQGGFWYFGCHWVNLNGVYLGGQHPDSTMGGKSVEWSDPWGHSFSLLKTEMSFRCP